MGRAVRKTGVMPRPLAADDLERLLAMRRSPDDFVNLGVVADGRLAGFLFARILRGEFGQAEPAATFDFIGIDPGSRGQGHGRRLMTALHAALRERGIHHLHSQAEWTSHALVGFFDAAGFKLGRRVVLERSVAEPLVEATNDV